LQVSCFAYGMLSWSLDLLLILISPIVAHGFYSVLQSFFRVCPILIITGPIDPKPDYYQYFLKNELFW